MENKPQHNPWFSIWVKPRQTIQEIIETNPRFRFVTLSFIYGLPWMLQMAQTLSLGSSWSFAYILIIALVLAIPVGAIAMSLSSLLLLWTGKLLKGKGTYYQVRAAVSWSNVPNIVSIAIWVLFFIFFGTVIFSKQFTSTPFAGYEAALYIGLSVIQLVAGVWGFIIFLHALGQVQGFSAWMALLNAILMAIILLVAGYLLALLVNWISFAGAGGS